MIECSEVYLCAFWPQFGGLEAIITAVMDEYPDTLSHRRELLVLGLVVVCFLGSLSTLTKVSFSEHLGPHLSTDVCIMSV